MANTHNLNNVVIDRVLRGIFSTDAEGIIFSLNQVQNFSLNCTSESQEIVDALGHTEVVDAAVAATCTPAGKTEGKHCAVCKDVLVAQEPIDALGHTEAEAKTEKNIYPTCTEEGKTVNPMEEK